MYFEIKETNLSDIINRLSVFDDKKDIMKSIIIKEINKFITEYINSDNSDIEVFKNKIQFNKRYSRDLVEVLNTMKEKKEIKIHRLSLEDLLVEFYQVNEKIFFKVNYNIEDLDIEISKMFKSINLNEIELLTKNKLFSTLIIENFRLILDK